MAKENKTPEAVATEEKTEAPAAEPEVKEKKAVKPKAKATKKVATKQAPKAESTPAKEEKPAEVEAEPVVEEKPEPKAPKPVGKESAGNPMLIPIIEKVTVNMSVGKSGTPLEQAVTIIKQLTNQNPSKRNARKTIREFGIRKGEPIACLVTLREDPAKEFLVKAFYAVENKISKYAFDRQGNFSFGIKEHINLPGTKYLPELGIHGMDVSVSLGRAGYRVKRRHRRQAKVGKDHQLTAEEAILFIKDEFDVQIL
ncbi:MAG: 50S ribosomal protein L5 [Candidatus Bathyarchaeota archaeon]|nr:50S ribosomal protein L5 [Candidatus Bathyarchaeota archaeon]